MNNQVINQEASQDFTNNLAKKMHPTATGEILQNIQLEFAQNYLAFRSTQGLEDNPNVRTKYSKIVALGLGGDNVIKYVYVPKNGSTINGNKDFTISYHGFRYLYKMNGIDVSVDLVFDGDNLSVERDINGNITNVIMNSANIFGQSQNNIIGAFAIIKYSDGHMELMHLTKGELEDIKSLSAKGSNAWKNSWRKMYKKIMYRYVFEHVALSTHSGSSKQIAKMQEALIVDEPAEETKQIQTVGEKMQEQVKAEQVEVDIIDEFNEILGGTDD